MTYEYFFGTPIWVLKNGDSQITKRAHRWATQYRESVPSVNRSNRGGYQSKDSSDFNIFPFTSHLQSRLYDLPEFRFINWWLNVNEKGDYNMGHTHPISTLSAVWYLTPNYGTLCIDNPHYQSRWNLLTQLGQEPMLRFDLDAGDIIVFPSDLYHAVEAHTEDEARMSIAINLEV